MQLKTLLALALAVGASGTEAQQSQITPSQASRIDSVFARYSRPNSPGCALGVSRSDAIILERAWGSANLEQPTAITPATIFEAGSVSKRVAG